MSEPHEYTPEEIEHLNNLFGVMADTLNRAAQKNPELAEQALRSLLERVREIKSEKDKQK